MTDKNAKESVVRAGRELVKSGLITRTWGNVSCRIDETYFAITPSGRDYMSLTPEDIVTVAVSDCSYVGDIKPSSEKGIHAEIYKYNPKVNFVIHTHQENASVISTLDLDTIQTEPNYPLLGGKVVCAAYGLPGTKKLRKAVAKALKKSEGNGIIMKHHGAICFGKDEKEAFKTASDLEEACDNFIAEKYQKMSNRKEYDSDKMRQFALSLIQREDKISEKNIVYCESERTEDGFHLITKNDETIHISFKERTSIETIKESLLWEAKIHKEIYQENNNINCIIHWDTPNTVAVSHADITLYPLVDDFAQIVGTKVKRVSEKEVKIAGALKNASAVLIEENGAYCCGVNKADTLAIVMILEKNSKAFLAGILFGKVSPIGWLDSKLMRFVYLKKYSKQMNGKDKKKKG